MDQVNAFVFRHKTKTCAEFFFEFAFGIIHAHIEGNVLGGCIISVLIPFIGYQRCLVVS